MIGATMALLVLVAAPPGVYSDNYQPLDTYLKGSPNVIHYDAVKVELPALKLSAGKAPVVNVNVPGQKDDKIKFP